MFSSKASYIFQGAPACNKNQAMSTAMTRIVSGLMGLHGQLATPVFPALPTPHYTILAGLFLMTVFTQSLFTFMCSDFMTLTLFTTRHNSISLISYKNNYIIEPVTSNKSLSRDELMNYFSESSSHFFRADSAL